MTLVSTSDIFSMTEEETEKVSREIFDSIRKHKDLLITFKEIGVPIGSASFKAFALGKFACLNDVAETLEIDLDALMMIVAENNRKRK